MSNNNIVENNKKTTPQGDPFEGLVKKVYRCYYLLNLKKKNFVIKQKYKVEDLENADYYFSKAKNKKKLDNMKNTELADVYFSYTNDNNEKIETYIECKSGNFQKKEIEKECITKLDNFGIKNVNKIVAFQCEEELKEEVKEFCQKNNIQLVNIVWLIKSIKVTLQVLPNYSLTNIEFEQDKNWNKINNIAGGSYNFCYKGIKINNEEHIFHGESKEKFLNWLSKNNFVRKEEDEHTISYIRDEKQDRLYLLIDCNNNILNKLGRIKVKKLKLTFYVVKYPPITQLIKVDNDDSFASIKDMLTKQEQIVFESGKIEEKV